MVESTAGGNAMGMADKLAIVLSMAGGGLPGPGHYVQMEMPPPAAEVVIAGQRGGQVAAHAQRVIEYEQAGSHLRVEGACVSACALILALPADRICVGPNARFGLHQPIRGLNGKFALEDLGGAITEVYPPFVQQWLKAHYGGLPSGRPQYIGYDVLRRHYPTCG